MADEKVQPATPAPETKLVGFAARFDEKEDAETLRLLQIAKTVGGAKSKEIVRLGVEAYIKTDKFKKSAQVIKQLGL